MDSAQSSQSISARVIRSPSRSLLRPATDPQGSNQRNYQSEQRPNVAEKIAASVRELRDNPNFLPSYHSIVVDECIAEIHYLHGKNAEYLVQIQQGTSNEVTEEMTSVFNVRQCTLERLKRCCCAYINERLLRIKEMRWKNGGKLPPETVANMAKAEQDWFKSYNQDVAEFQMSIGRLEDEEEEALGIQGGVNLLALNDPPKSSRVMVRSLQDYGEFETAEGLILNFVKNSLHSVPQRDAEPLIRRGILERV